jgi:hypothetical protein
MAKAASIWIFSVPSKNVTKEARLGDGQRSPTQETDQNPVESALRRRGSTLNLAFCFALFVGFAVVTQGQAEEHYIYQDSDGKLRVNRWLSSGQGLFVPWKVNVAKAHSSVCLSSRSKT